MFNVSIHDITESTLEKAEKIKSILQKEGVEKITYLLIPYYHEKEKIKEEVKKLTKNGEIILHGFTHKGGDFHKLSPMNLFTSGEGEFITYTDFNERVSKGIETLENIGFHPEGFIPPAWLYKKELIPVLKEKGLLFMTDRYSIINIQKNKKTFSPVVTFSSRGIIEKISVKTFLTQIEIYSRFLKVVRIALHPPDVENEEKTELLRKGIEILKQNRKDVFLKETL